MGRCQRSNVVAGNNLRIPIRCGAKFRYLQEYTRVNQPSLCSILGFVNRFVYSLYSTTYLRLLFEGVYLTSLTFIHEGIEDKLPGNLINFGKQQRVAEVIREIQYWQSKNYDLAPLAPVMAYLEEAFNSIEVTNEEFFNTLSIEREPESDE